MMTAIDGSFHSVGRWDGKPLFVAGSQHLPALHGFARRLSSLSVVKKAVSANGESVSRNGENPGKQHQVTGKSIPLGGKSGIS